MRTFVLRPWFAVSTFALSAIGLAACSEDAAGTDGSGAACGGPTPEERAANQLIFDGLKATCEGCHANGARGYFASIEAFESLVVYEPKQITPGNPDASEFVKVLEGNGTRAFTQMPISGPNYAEIVASGAAKLDVGTIRTWVKNLKARDRDTRPSIDAPRVTRLSASDVLRALYAQLGLNDDDFFAQAFNYSVEHKTSQSDGRYSMTSPDAIPAPYEDLPAERFVSLGGGSAMLQIKSDETTSPSFLGTVTQVSQAWCRIALDKPDNAALIPAGMTLATSMEDPAAVEAVIARWFLHFHAVKAPPESIEEMFSSVFLPVEAETDAKTGYVGVCSALIRHPDWIFY
jgi:hypothetical protein